MKHDGQQQDTIDLARTYLSLDGHGKVAVHPVDASFWQTINSNRALLGSLVGIYASGADWPHWEMHPAGEEILVLLEGALTLVLDSDGKETQVPLLPGEAVVVPRGTWHRALVAVPSKLLGITYGEGTQHRPLA